MIKMNKNKFSERMKEMRTRAGLTQAALSKITSIAPATLSSYESEDKPKSPPIDKALTIANALNVSLDWLCGFEKNDNEDNELTASKIFNAIVTLFKFESSYVCISDPGNKDTPGCTNISISDDIICDFVEELGKIESFLFKSDMPNYLKASLRKSLIDHFVSRFCSYSKEGEK